MTDSQQNVDSPKPAKLPFWRTVGQSYAIWATNLATLMRFTWLWLLLMAPVLFAVHWWFAPIHIEMAQNAFEGASEATGNFALAKILDATARLPMLASIAVAWHRFVLRDARPAGRGYLRMDKVVFTYLAFFFIIFHLPHFVMDFFIGRPDTIEFFGVEIPGFFVFLILYAHLYIYARLSIVFPAIALGDNNFTFRRAWHATRRNGWRLFFGQLICVVPFILLLSGIWLVLLAHGEKNVAAVGSLLIDYLMVCVVPIEISFLSLAYRHLAEDCGEAEDRSAVQARTSHRFGWKWAAVSIVVVLAVLGRYALERSQIFNQEPQEAGATSTEYQTWLNSKRVDTIESYQAYIKWHPNGKYTGEAQSRINALKTAEVTAKSLSQKVSDEEVAWLKVERNGSARAYRDYLSRHPNGKFAEHARQAIAKLENNARQDEESYRQQEREAWQQAVRHNTMFSYEAYIDTYPQGEHRASAYNRRGIHIARKGNLHDAISDFSRAIELKPEMAKGYNNRGFAYLKLKAWDRAIADFDRAIELNARYSEAYFNRALAYAKTRQLNQAIANYTKAIELKPGDAKAYNNRGNAYGRTKQYDRAIADFDKAIALKPDYALAYANRGYGYERKGHLQRAIFDYRRAIDLHPEQRMATAGLSRLGIAK